jgi:hypothetical protein
MARGGTNNSKAPQLALDDTATYLPKPSELDYITELEQEIDELKKRNAFLITLLEDAQTGRTSGRRIELRDAAYNEKWLARLEARCYVPRKIAEGVTTPCRVIRKPGAGGYGWAKYDGKDYPAHRVVYEIEHPGELEPDEVVRHKCVGRRGCNAEDHLDRGSHADNARDRQKAARHGNAKLDEEKVREIFGLREAGMPIKAIAIDFDISPQHVKAVLERTVWGWVEL